jgi:hypothetical protein
MMSQKMNVVKKQVQLSTHHADRLSRLAKIKALSEDQIIEKALDILFSLTDLLDQQVEREGWSLLSEGALQRVWNNEEDACYDQWRELYGISAR